MESTEQHNRDIEALQKAVESKDWGQVNTLLGKEHCMKFFTQIILKNRSDYACIYINSVVNTHQQIEEAMRRFFSGDGIPSMLIKLALVNKNAILFFQKVTKNELKNILALTNWAFVDTHSLKNCPKILEILSKCEYFPSQLYLVKFLQDLQQEIHDGADCSATTDAILTLTQANGWDEAGCTGIIHAEKLQIYAKKHLVLTEEEKESLIEVLSRHVVFSRPTKNARNLGQPVSTQISDKVPKSQEVKQEEEEVVEEVEEKDPETNQDPSPSTSAHNSWVDRIVQVALTPLSKLLSIISIKYFQVQHNNLDQKLTNKSSIEAKGTSVEGVDDSHILVEQAGGADGDRLDLYNSNIIPPFTPPSPLSIINWYVSKPDNEIVFLNPHQDNKSLTGAE